MARIFAAATLGPLVLIFAGFALGGWIAAAALLAMTALVYTLDRLVHVALPAAGPDVEFPAGVALSVALAVGQIALLPVAVGTLASGTLNAWETVAMAYASVLWLGQVGNSNAHELIHRPARALRRLGTVLFVTVLYGHHASAHPKVHHTHVATVDDPATARLGESVYAYLPRSWIGSFRAGHKAEREMLERRFGAGWRRHDPYPRYVAGAALLCLAALLLAGPIGLAWYIALSLGTQVQLLLSDYVQHYGLLRATVSPGRPEPVGLRHSWNAPHWYSGAMMLNAPRHSAHHAAPARPFHELDAASAETAPHLPRSLPVMASAALVPPLWHRMMDDRARRWRPDATRPAGAGA